MCIDKKYIKEVLEPGLGILPELSNNKLILLPSSRQNDYMKAEYFKALGEIKNLIHFTSLRTLFSIINEGSLRLYNLNNPEDIEEFTNGANIVFENPNKDKYVKDDLFFASFCKEEEILNPVLWKLYGDDEKGACIIFDIVNSNRIDEWNYFQIGKTMYDNKTLIKFKALHDDFITNNEINIEDIHLSILLKTIFCFYKRRKYSYEKEVRIIKDRPDNDKRKYDINREGKIVGYLPLKLYRENEINNSDAPYNFVKPILKITKIVLGEKVDSSIKNDEKGTNLRAIFRDRFNYEITPESM